MFNLISSFISSTHMFLICSFIYFSSSQKLTLSLFLVFFPFSISSLKSFPSPVYFIQTYYHNITSSNSSTSSKSLTLHTLSFFYLFSIISHYVPSSLHLFFLFFIFFSSHFFPHGHLIQRNRLP